MTEKEQKIKFSVGICAYNEGENIGRLLKSILAQKLDEDLALEEIIVVTSGCTDDTEEIVLQWRSRDKRIKLISEKERKGKASAVNQFIKNARSKFLVLSSADLLLEKNCLQILIKNLKQKGVGSTAPRVVPLNKDDSLVGFAVNLQWNLHHKVNLQFPERPKVGELIAFKKIFKRIPPSTAVDEASIEPLIHLQGYKVKYCPEAIVYNKGPETIYNFLRQRRRIYAGHTDLRKRYGYSVVTYSNMRLLGALLANIQWNKKFFLMTPVVMVLEGIGRMVGFIDYTFKTRTHTVWKVAKTTKKLS